MLEMSPLSVVTVVFISLLIGIFLGHPLAFVFGGLAVISGLIWWGPGSIAIFPGRVYATMDSWVLVAVPLFIFMANILQRSGLAEKVFDSFRYLLGPIRGGVSIAVIVISVMFAACTGIVGAAVVTMATLAIPPLVRYGYNKELAVGTVGAGGTLGILIPPSIMLVIMGSVAGVSVGKLFAGAIAPGLLLAAMYIVYNLLICAARPGFGPPIPLEERRLVPVSRRIRSAVVHSAALTILILAVMGSILSGVATPTEAAGVGAFSSMLLAVAYRKFSWRMLRDSVLETAKTNCMALIIVCGASCLTGVFSGIGGGEAVANLLLGAHLGKWGIFALMMLIVFVLGMFIDWIGIVMIVFPLFIPIATELGFNLLWFVMMIAINLQCSFLTPPFGYTLFYLKGVAPEGVTMENVYRGIVPFVLFILLVLALAAAFPELVLWLPSKMVASFE